MGGKKKYIEMFGSFMEQLLSERNPTYEFGTFWMVLEMRLDSGGPRILCGGS